jgi:DNA/RNA endonuclease YhcR with UshA esterase domain
MRVGMRELVLLSAVLGLVMIYAGVRLSEPERVETQNLTSGMVGSQVLLSGRVMDLYEHPDGHLFLLVGEENRTVSVPLFSSLRRGMRVEMLDWVEVRGRVKEWKGELEVVPGRPEDVRVRREPPRRVGEIGEGEVGRLVKVEGEVRRVTRMGENCTLLTLAEGENMLKLFLAFPARVEAGARVTAAGRVQLYRGELEVVVKRSSHLYL